MFRKPFAVVLLLALSLTASVAVADTNEAHAPAQIDKQRRITAGNLHTCAILDTGSVKCWGGNDNGQLGNGTTTTSTVPVAVAGLSAVLQLSAGGEHTCALVHGGVIYCWGLNGNGQLGNNSTLDSLVPVAVAGISDATAIASGGFHSCAVIIGGTVKCWGNDGMGAIGDGTPGDTSSTPTTVVGITGANPAVALSLGEFHSCALLDDGSVKCWGHNGFGQIGDGTTVDRSTATSVTGLPEPALVLTTGSSHSCVLLDDDDKTVRCWGHNAYGSLGHATSIVDDVMQPSATPLEVRFDADPDPFIEDLEPLTGVSTLGSGQFHTCGQSTAGVRCWGNNNRGQLGADPIVLTGELEDSVNALTVPGIGIGAAVTAGGFHTCALDGTTLKCWGYNFFGQLGGYVSSNSRPVTVTALSGATLISAGTDFACALINDETTDKPVCWGSNTDGRLGAGLGVSDTTIRVPVSGIASAVAIDAGNGHACVLVTLSSAPRCWGLGTDGQLGNGAGTSSSTPVTVSGFATATTVNAGGALGSEERGFTCSVRNDGTVRCWGRNANGQLGDDTTTDRATPVTVQTSSGDLTSATQVVSGGFHSCALISDSSVRCWGFNGSGQLGDATTTERHVAVRVQTDTDPDVDLPLTGVTALAAGANHTCARTVAQTVMCWGANGSGQLGDGTNTARSIPTLVPAFDAGFSFEQAKLITAGDSHTCATRGDGGMSCWGENGDGQLGNGSTSDSNIPVQVYAAPPAEANPFILAISASRRNTCARLLDTTVSCWGDNGRGQLGDGLGQFRMSPVTVNGLGAIGTNHIPNPVDDTATTTPGVPVNVSVLANDSDADGHTLTVTAVGVPSHGGAVNNGDGTVTYTPDPGFCGDDSFTYTVSDGIAPVPATVTILMNCPPVAVNDVATTGEDTPIAISVLVNDSDPDADPLTVTAASDPPRGSTTFTATAVTYTPDLNECGPPADTFNYTISDGQGHTATAAVTVTINCANDGPDAVDDAVATAENIPVTVNVLANDTDLDGDGLSLGTVGAAGHGTAVANGSAVDYTPSSGYCGPDSFTYTASDGALTDTATVSVSVTCVADSPNAVDDVKTTVEDTSVLIGVLANDTDPDGDTLSIASVTDPLHGTAVDNGGGFVEYQPDENFCGNDTFTYVATDGSLTDSATVTVTVTCVNDSPVAADDAANTPEDTTIHVHVLTNDSDPDADTLTLVSATDPAHGTTSLAVGDAVAYTPDPNYCGSDSFDYTVRDSSGATAIGHVFVTVECVNDAPVIHMVPNMATPWGENVAHQLAADDADTADTATYSLVTGPVGASVAPGGGFGWNPSATQVGVHTITVRVTDAAGAFSQTSFTVTVSKRATTTVYTGVSTGQYSDPAAMGATVVDTLSGAGVPGRVVTFGIGALSSSATTNALGMAGTSMVLAGPVGATPLTTSFPGDAAYLGSSDSDPFTLAKELVTVQVTGQHLTQVTPSPVQLSAIVTEEADGFLGSALSTARVSFQQLGGGVLCSAQVSGTGAGTGTATCMTASLTTGSRVIIATVTGPSYVGLADVAVFTVAAPGAGDAAGAGSIGSLDDFGFQVKSSKKDGPFGEAVHVFIAGGSAFVVQSGSLQSLTRTCTGGSQKVCRITLQATGASTVLVDLTNGTVLPVPGTSSIRIDATDNGVAGDTYAVSITGATMHTLGSPGSQVPISQGNIRIPS